MASLAQHGNDGQVATTVSEANAAGDADAAEAVAGTNASARTSGATDAATAAGVAATTPTTGTADPLIMELVQFAHELADASQAVILPMFR